MKFSALAVSAVALAVVYGGSAVGQSVAPATMQPIPNPPETAKPAHMGKHHGKHHAAHVKTDMAAPPAK